MNKVYINGRIRAARDAKLSIFDRGYLFGEGAFETLRAYHGEPAFVDLHYARLRNNCRQIRIQIPLTRSQFQAALVRVLKANRKANCALRVTATSVQKSAQIGRPAKLPTNLVMTVRDLPPRSARLYTKGAAVIMVRSVSVDSPETSQIKSTSYLLKMLARAEVAKAGAAEGLLCDARGHVMEGTATNLFIVRRGTLHTSPVAAGVLPGITRALALIIAKELRIPVREGTITKDHLRKADEIFLTGTTTEIMPIREVRKLTRKRHTPGPVTQRIMEGYQRLLPTSD